MRGRRFHTASIVHSICRSRSLFQLDEKRDPADWAPTTPAQPKDSVFPVNLILAATRTDDRKPLTSLNDMRIPRGKRRRVVSRSIMVNTFVSSLNRQLLSWRSSHDFLLPAHPNIWHGSGR